MQLQFSIGRRLVAVRRLLVAVGGQLVAFGELALQVERLWSASDAV